VTVLPSRRPVVEVVLALLNLGLVVVGAPDAVEIVGEPDVIKKFQ